MTDTIYYPLLILALLCLVLALPGCGGPIQTHTTAIRISAGTIAVGGSMLSEARSQALDRVTEETEGQPREERVIALREESARWDPVGAAINTGKEILQAWLDTVRAVEAGAENLWARVPLLVARLVRLWGRTVELARTLGLDLPAIPSQVTMLMGSIGSR